MRLSLVSFLLLVIPLLAGCGAQSPALDPVEQLSPTLLPAASATLAPPTSTPVPLQPSPILPSSTPVPPASSPTAGALILSPAASRTRESVLQVSATGGPPPASRATATAIALTQIAPIFLTPLATTLPDTGGADPTETAAAIIPVTGGTQTAVDSVALVEDQIRQINEQLTTGRLAYDPPERLAVGETTILRVGLVPVVREQEPSADATLAADLNVPVEDLETVTIATSLLMEATLSGDPGAFTIRPLHQNARQLIAADEVTQWAWQVTALRPGTHNLTLTVSVVLDVGGVRETRSKTYSNNIRVQVSPLITGGYLLGLYWLPLLAAGLAGAGLTARQLRFRAQKRGLLAALAAQHPEKGERYIFVSYSHREERFVIPLARDLMARGIRVWLDQREIIAGEDWMEEIETGLQNTDALLLVLSPRAVASRYVMGEVATAQKARKPVFPIMYKTCDLPPNLTKIHFVDFRTDVPSALDTLVENLTKAGYHPEE